MQTKRKNEDANYKSKILKLDEECKIENNEEESRSTRRCSARIKKLSSSGLMKSNTYESSTEEEEDEENINNESSYSFHTNKKRFKSQKKLTSNQMINNLNLSAPEANRHALEVIISKENEKYAKLNNSFDNTKTKSILIPQHNNRLTSSSTQKSVRLTPVTSFNSNCCLVNEKNFSEILERSLKANNSMNVFLTSLKNDLQQFVDSEELNDQKQQVTVAMVQAQLQKRRELAYKLVRAFSSYNQSILQGLYLSQSKPFFSNPPNRGNEKITLTNNNNNNNMVFLSGMVRPYVIEPLKSSRPSPHEVIELSDED